ncbi:hypothetical protein KR222_001587 [Zaprionus bogoriensis]|nr:hypothetical protein KR222_001587 [Zaprionus bogoriensis]
MSLKFPTDCGLTPYYNRPYVVGGQPAEADEYSWMASLQYANEPNITGVCAGSVINSRYVLTAAHCVVGHKPITVLGGRPYCDYGTLECQRYKYYDVESTVYHFNYKPNDVVTMHYDIALLRLRSAIQFDGILKPICLPFGTNNILEPSANTQVIVAGWGLTLDMNLDSEPPKKRGAIVPLWSATQCLEDSRRKSDQICAGSKGKGSCNGDSGGPLMNMFKSKRMVLEGIVSYGLGVCGNGNTPSVFTRVRSYGRWLDRNMNV